MEEHLEMAKKLAKYMFFQNETNPNKPGKNGDAVQKITEGMSEKEIVEIMLEKTSDKAEQHFYIQSWLLKHRFKTNQGLLQTSYWYHRDLPTGS